MPRARQPTSPFRYFNSSREVIPPVVMMYVRFPLSLSNVEDLLFEHGIDICHQPQRPHYIVWRAVSVRLTAPS